ncbi:MAG: hypothetical protein LBP80_02075 [Treponema sp.]|nr:hypothetical protein [Treponema sp.]
MPDFFDQKNMVMGKFLSVIQQGLKDLDDVFYGNTFCQQTMYYFFVTIQSQHDFRTFLVLQCFNKGGYRLLDGFPVLCYYNNHEKIPAEDPFSRDFDGMAGSGRWLFRGPVQFLE